MRFGFIRFLTIGLFFGSVFITKSVYALEANACSKQASTVCVELRSVKQFNTKDEGKFVLEVKGLAASQIRKVRVDLWMDVCTTNSAHGSAPVAITSISPNQYRIENAWFVMPGMWLIKTIVETNSGNLLIEVPVFIAN